MRIIKYIFFLLLAVLFLGCSQTVTYPQIKGKTLDNFHLTSNKLDKINLLHKVDIYADKVFTDLYKKTREDDKLYQKNIFLKIYNNQR